MAGTRAKPDYFYVHGLFTEIVNGNPVEVEGVNIPSVFKATFYVIDNHGRKLLPNDNWRTIPTWTIELILKANKSGYIEPLHVAAKGARSYLNTEGKLEHSQILFGEPKQIPFDNNQPLTARHFAQINRYRASLIADATASIFTHYEYTGNGIKDKWTTGNANREIPEEIILNIRDNTKKRSYTKVTDSFLEEVARKYLAILETNDPTPTKTLHEQHYKLLVGYDRLSSYLTKCRNMGLIPEIPGKSKKPARKKGR